MTNPEYRALMKALRRVDINLAELLNSSTVQNEIDWLTHARDKIAGTYKNVLFAEEYRKKETCHE